MNTSEMEVSTLSSQQVNVQVYSGHCTVVLFIAYFFHFLLHLEQLSDCLPSQALLEPITSAVLSHVMSPDQPLATVLLGLKTILSLSQYNAGLLHIYL